MLLNGYRPGRYYRRSDHIAKFKEVKYILAYGRN